MNRFFPIFKKELREIVRTKKLLILVILFAFIALSSPIIAKLLPQILSTVPSEAGFSIDIPDPTWRESIDQLAKNLSQFGLIVITIMFAGSIASEKSKKTLELVLSKPVSRTKYILAKFTSSALATIIIFLLSQIIFYIYTVSLFEPFSLLYFVYLSLVLLLYLLFILFATLFFSALAKSQIIALGLAFLFQVLFAVALELWQGAQKYSPNYIFGNYDKLVEQGNISDFIPSIITGVVILALFVVGSIYVFRNQEIER